MEHSEKQNSNVTTGSYIIEDKIQNRDYVGGVIIEKHYFDVCDTNDMNHKKRILVPEKIFDKAEIQDIVELTFYYKDDQLTNVEINLSCESKKIIHIFYNRFKKGWISNEKNTR